MVDAGKPVMLVAVDDSVHSYYALEWTLDHFFAAYGPDHPFKLKLVHARPTPSSVIGFTGPGISGPIPGSSDVASLMEIDTKKTAKKLIDKATDMCKNKSVNDVSVIVLEGDARDVMIEAVEKNKASILVLGSHGYGVVKRVILGSVSDYCAHHCNCTVMIVKKPKSGHGR